MRVVEGECFIVAGNGWVVREYLQTNLTVRFCKAPPYNVWRVVAAHAWVVQVTSASG